MRSMRSHRNELNVIQTLRDNEDSEEGIHHLELDYNNANIVEECITSFTVSGSISLSRNLLGVRSNKCM
jgi:hypothetical protein